MSESNVNSDFSQTSDEEDESSTLSSSSDDEATDSSSSENSMQLDVLEPAKFGPKQLMLPRGLCENRQIFEEFFSMETWNMLSEEFRAYLLNKFLPSFAELADDRKVKDETVAMLFQNQIERFGKTPLIEFHRNLEKGNYRPDVKQLRKSISKSKKREQRYRLCERVSHIAKQAFVSRERLLRASYEAGADEMLNLQKRAKRVLEPVEGNHRIFSRRTGKRYRIEVSQLNASSGKPKLSADEASEDTDMDSMEDLVKVLKREGGDKESPGLPKMPDKCVFSTQFKRIKSVSDEDAARAHYDAKQLPLNHKNFRKYLMDHKRKKLLEPGLPEFDTNDIRLRDVYARAQVGGNFKCVFMSAKSQGRKPKSKTKISATPFATLTKPNLFGDKLVANSADRENVRKDTATSRTEQHSLKRPASTDRLCQAEETTNKLEKLPQQKILQNIDYLPQKLVQEAPTILTSVEAPITHNLKRKATPATTELPTNVMRNESLIKISSDFNGPTLGKKSEQFQSVNISQPAAVYMRDNKRQTLEGLHRVANLQQDQSWKNATTLVTAGRAVPPQKSFVMSTQVPPSTELVQETHACFFSLVRDFFCATPNHRMQYEELQERVQLWINSPITALNDWYLNADDWLALTKSAIRFLAGDCAEQPDEYVPYIEYKPNKNIYQWIGAGRDSDARLLELFNYWLPHRNKILNTNSNGEQLQLVTGTNILNTNTEASNQMLMISKSQDADDDMSSERCLTPPPPPRCPTTWTVKAATPEEVAEFQRQERERFENPHRAYTYRMHGYESVVGPVKGVYSPTFALTKPRLHSMMIGNRPNFITILTLVRDATARLPNGEGTRADISELLKCSQYISNEAAENVLQTIVSGALDRMHTENDACVRYDPKRKIWIYLHRNRTEEEFEKMHQQNQGVGKHKKPTNRKNKPLKPNIGGGNDDEVMITESPTSPTSSSSNFIHSLPALVPSNPIIITASNANQALKIQQQQQQQQQNVKCPPVPPLKYNILPAQHKQLLRAANIKLEPKDSLSQPEQVPVVAGKKELLQLNLNAVSTQQNNSGSNTVLQNNTTPIMVATSTGYKTVHVSNSTSVTHSSTQVNKSDVVPQLSATLGGKKVALNQSIIINKIPQQTIAKRIIKRETPKANTNTNNPAKNIIVIGGKQKEVPQLLQQNLNSQVTDAAQASDATAAKSGEQKPTTTTAFPKHLIRLVQQTPSAAGTGNKPVISFPLTTGAITPVVNASNKAPVQIFGQRVIQTPIAGRPTTTKSTVNNITFNNNTTAPVTPGAIYRMPAQAFVAAMQQKQNPPALVKQPHQLLMAKAGLGNAAAAATATAAATSNKNIVMQPIATGNLTPVSQASNIKQTTPSGTQKVHTINTSSLTQQQQKMIFQSFKPQNIKTLQFISNNSSSQQPPNVIEVNAAAGLVPSSTSLSNSKNVQPSSAAVGNIAKLGNVAASQPQSLAKIISLEDLLGKQEQQTGARTFTLTTSNKTPQTMGNIIQLKSTGGIQNDTAGATQQYSIVSQSPRNVFVSTAAGTQTMPGIAQLVSKAGGSHINIAGSNAKTTTLAGGNLRLKSSLSNYPGKQVVLTTGKGTNVKTLTGQQQLHNLRTSTGTVLLTSAEAAQLQANANLKILNQSSTQPAASASAASSISSASTPLQTVIVGNQILRLDQLPNNLRQQLQSGARIIGATSANVASSGGGAAFVVGSAAGNNASGAQQQQQPTTDNMPKTLILGSGGQTIRLQSSTASAPSLQTSACQTAGVGAANKNVLVTNLQKNTAATTNKSSNANRMIFAVQGSGGSIILSPNYPGASMNLKSLQNVKVVSMGQAPNATGSREQQQTAPATKGTTKFVNQSMLRSSSSGFDKS